MYYSEYSFVFCLSEWLRVCYLENVGEVSQVEDVVKAYRCGEEVLADFLMQTDSCLDKQNNKIDRRRDGLIDIGTDKQMALLGT